MILGTGIDLAEVSRFKKWITDGELLKRYFNDKERKENDCLNLTDRQISSLCQHYAVRFAAKEAFSKALGTGVVGFELKDVCVLNESSGKPYLVLENKAKEIFDSKCPGGKIHISLSHEKEFAIASVIIEI